MHKKNPILSVVVPATRLHDKTKNLSKWLSDLHSSEVQVIIVHDVQDDQTSELLRSILDEIGNPSIRFLEGVYNSPGLARNAGLALVDSDWIWFVDSDDLPNISEGLKVIGSATQSAEVLVGAFRVKILDHHLLKSASKNYGSFESVAYNPGLWRMIFRTLSLGDLKFSEYKMAEDQLFLLEFDFFNRNVEFFENHLYTYFQGVVGQLTSNTVAIREIEQVIFRTIELFIHHHRNETKKFVAIMLIRQTISLINRSTIREQISLINGLVRNLAKLETSDGRILLQAIVIIFKMKRVKNERNRLTLYLTGGLGNQLFQYAAALSRDPECLFFDAHLGKPRLNRRGRPDIMDFELPIEPRTLEKRKNQYFFSKVAGFFLRRGVSPSKTKDFFLSKYFFRVMGSTLISIWLWSPTKIVQATDNGFFKMPKKTSNEYFIGYFQTFVWASKPEVLNSLRTMQVTKPSSEFINFYNSHKENQAVLVHVRLGDYKTERGFGIPALEYYESALKILDATQAIEKIWLFSNEPEQATSFIPKSYRNRILIIPAFGGSAAETLQAMRLAKRYVIGNSSLSWWGAFLSFTESPEVIAPNPWFRSNLEPSLIIPPNWIRVDAWPIKKHLGCDHD
jgi:glycosyltransferase involved in cell wall biosynthesis